MKKISIIVILLSGLLIANSCNNHSASIKGKVENAGGRKLYLEELSVSERKVVDSVKMNDKGDFSFRYKFQKAEPAFIILRADSVTLATLLINEGEDVKYAGDYKHTKNYTVEGSEGSALVKDLNAKQAVFAVKIDSLVNVLEHSANNDDYPEVAKKINSEAGVLAIKHKQALVRFIVTHPTSFASFTALYQKMPGEMNIFGKKEDMMYYKILVDSLSPRYPKSAYVMALNDDYKAIQNNINFDNIIEKATVSGSPDIELNNTTGTPVKLSSLRGNIVLLDFWVTKNPKCLMNNRDLLETYNKYHSKGFEVYQVSEDEDKNKWMEMANNQQLPWVNVSDAPGFYALRVYNVQQIPANYLIDKEGNIVGRNLERSALEKKLDELLVKK